MIPDLTLTAPVAPVSETSPASKTPSSVSRRIEDLIVVFALGLMVLLPLAEAVLRKFFHTGISSSAALVQHLCLVLGMAGGAIAARDNRLLSLSALTDKLKGRFQHGARIFSHGFAAAITLVLGLASMQFVLQERAAGNDLAYGIQLWVVESVMPVGYLLIAIRLIWHAGINWHRRAIAAALTACLIALAAWLPISHAHLLWPALALLLTAAVFGAPIFIILGGAAVILFWGDSQPLAVLPIDHYGLVVNATLPTIPLFTLAGYFMAESGACGRLVRVSDALVGHFRGGPAVGAAIACAFFTSFTGASGVTILALGGLLMPILLASRYPEKSALGLITGAGSLGLLFPPCLPLILYAIIAHVPIEEMFLAGLLPGLLLVGLVAAYGVWAGGGNQVRRKFSLRVAGAAIWEAKWELALPFVALGALFGGFATPLEAAALTAFYAFCIETFIHRELKILRDVAHVITECALLVGGVLLILGVALGLTDYLIGAEIPDKLLTWVNNSIHDRWLFLIALNLLLLIVGCLMDIYSAIIVVVPLIVPLGAAFGIDPLHLGIIFLANLELGYLTPPVGMNLFLSSYRFGKPVSEVTRASLPMLLILFIGVLLITYLPVLTKYLPGLLHG